jgi:CBS domain-containing protein
VPGPEGIARRWSGPFQPYAVAEALKNLSAYPNFKLVVLLEADGRLVSYIPGWLLRSQMEPESVEGRILLDCVNQGDVDRVRQASGMLTKTILPQTTNADALEEMEKLGLDALPVVDPATSSLKGVVERDRILARMFLTLAKA